MRDLFPGYYSPTEEQFKILWQEAIFVFDANILLHTYRYSEETRAKFFQILRALNGRIWLPHQVALEFQEHRLDVLSHRRRAYEAMKRELKNAVANAKDKAFKAIEGERKSSPLWTDLEKAFEIPALALSIDERVEFLDKQIAALPALRGEDFLRGEIDSLFEGLVGAPDDNAEEKGKEAKRRCEAKIPPGYEDHKKDESRRYNDAVAWLQTLDFAKEKQKPIIFVTDDTKEDWFLKKEGQTIGPRPELVEEMLIGAEVSFYLYTGDSFIEHGAKQFVSSTSSTSDEEIEAAVKEAREVRNEWERKSSNEQLDENSEEISFNEILRRQMRSALNRPQRILGDNERAVGNDYAYLSTIVDNLKWKINKEKSDLEAYLPDSVSMRARELVNILEAIWQEARFGRMGVRRVAQNVEALDDILDVEDQPYRYSIDKIRALSRMGRIIEEDELAIRAFVIREMLVKEQNEARYIGEIPWPPPLRD